jgi:hypothetical protein
MDFSNIFSIPSNTITIPHNINSVRIIGRGINHLFNTHIVVANRVNPLIIEFQNFMMQAPVGMDGIRSNSSSALELRFSGINRINGGAGANAAAGQNGGRGGNGIYSVGNVNIYSIGQQRSTIFGGTGGAVADGGNPGGRGGNGGHGVTAKDINLRGEFNLRGGNGGQGGRGANNSGIGNHGRNGGNGGDGGTAIYASGEVAFSQGMRFADIAGGTGGIGGRGGNGTSTSTYGGHGGIGGRGGHGIEGNIVKLNLSAMELFVRGGAGGTGGGSGSGTRAAGQTGRRGGAGGNGGNAVFYTSTIENSFSLSLFERGVGGVGGHGGSMSGGASNGPRGHNGTDGGTVVRKNN